MLHARKAWKGWAFCKTDNVKKSRVLNSEAALFTFVFTLVHPCLSFFTLSIWCWSHEHVQGSSTPLTCDLPLPPGLFEAILTPPCPKFGYSSFYMACSCWLWFWLIHRLWCNQFSELWFGEGALVLWRKMASKSYVRPDVTWTTGATPHGGLLAIAVKQQCSRIKDILYPSI